MNTLLKLKQLEIKEKLIYVIRNESDEFDIGAVEAISNRYTHKFE